MTCGDHLLLIHLRLGFRVPGVRTTDTRRILRALTPLSLCTCALPALLRSFRYYARMTMDFQTNKRVCEEVAIIPSKALKNKIAGYATHLMKRIQRGPVRGISLKLQEEERERRMDFVPEVSAVDTDIIDVDPETKAMLRSLDMGSLPGIVVQQASSGGGWKDNKDRRR